MLDISGPNLEFSELGLNLDSLTPGQKVDIVTTAGILVTGVINHVFTNAVSVTGYNQNGHVVYTGYISKSNIIAHQTWTKNVNGELAYC